MRPLRSGATIWKCRTFQVLMCSASTLACTGDQQRIEDGAPGNSQLGGCADDLRVFRSTQRNNGKSVHDLADEERRDFGPLHLAAAQSRHDRIELGKRVCGTCTVIRGCAEQQGEALSVAIAAGIVGCDQNGSVKEGNTGVLHGSSESPAMKRIRCSRDSSMARFVSSSVIGGPPQSPETRRAFRHGARARLAPDESGAAGARCERACLV